VVERGVLREQLVHADHVEVLDGVAVEAVHKVQPDPPQHLGKQQQAREAKDVRHGFARGDGAMGREPADQRGNDQRRDIGDAGGAERGQQHPRQGEAPEQRHLPAVVAQHEQHRALPVRSAAAMVRSRHRPSPLFRAASHWLSCGKESSDGHLFFGRSHWKGPGHEEIAT